MSKYTTQLRWIVEQTASEVPPPVGHRYPTAVYKKLGLDEYPIFDEAHRQVLNDKIIDHYYFREIGLETAALFRFYLRRKMNEIMPYYNKLYLSELFEFDPLTNYGRTVSEAWEEQRTSLSDSESETDTASVEGNGHGEYESSSNVYQDTPMSLLNNVGAPQISDMDYATNVTFDNSETDGGYETDREGGSYTAASSGTDSSGDGSRSKIENGYAGKSPSKLLEEYRAVILNIDMMVIKDLERLFMGVY